METCTDNTRKQKSIETLPQTNDRVLGPVYDLTAIFMKAPITPLLAQPEDLNSSNSLLDSADNMIENLARPENAHSALPFFDRVDIDNIRSTNEHLEREVKEIKGENKELED